MKWWKKIQRKLRIKRGQTESLRKRPSAPIQVTQTNEKQMNTRVAYQYPTGKFRFPLIQDNFENGNRELRTISNKRNQVPNEKLFNRYENKKEKPKEYVKEPWHKVESKNKQPFTPTNIPSPIYGFNRPEKKDTAPFEYELNESFVTADLQKEREVKQPLPLSEMEEQNVYPIDKKIGEESHLEPETKDKVEEVSQSDKFKELKDGTDVVVMKETAEAEHKVKEEAERMDQTEAADENSPSNSNAIPLNADSELKQKDSPKERKHVPFNVLMLSKDQERWQRQKVVENEPHEQTIKESAATIEEPVSLYEFPAWDLLSPPVAKKDNKEWLEEQAALLDETLENFNVRAHVVGVSQGPSVTRFEVQPDRGVKVNKITNLADDIKLSMAARDIRIEAPIPGKRSVGIELPNHVSRPVQISEIIKSPTFTESTSPLTAALGLNISGEPVVTDLRKMPHGLIAGATGSGKSVCINSILVSLLYKADPRDVKLLLIDPKMVELAPYNHIPHLVSPVITDVKAATAALKWAVDEMERRYELFAHTSVRDITRFNEIAETKGHLHDKLPYIVIVIDELADLMMMAPADVEEAICRIAQKARACGIHLLIATQRPSVDVITGLIKANVPTRIAFSVSSQVDSRTVIDVGGAEKLLGRGDMLFLENGSSKPVRLQGTFVSDDEIDDIISHVRDQGEPEYLFRQEELLKKAEIQENEDELFVEACEFVVKQGSASTSLLQRQFRIGYNRAARLMMMMEEHGIISEARGSRPRDVLIKESELDVLKDLLANS